MQFGRERLNVSVPPAVAGEMRRELPPRGLKLSRIVLQFWQAYRDAGYPRDFSITPADTQKIA